MNVNFFGTLSVSEHLFPLLREGARVVHLSSMSGRMVLSMMEETLQEELKAFDYSMKG